MAAQRKKIAMIGSGMIGGTMAFLCAVKELGDVVLFDIAPTMPKGKALDVSHVCSVFDTNIAVEGTSDYSKIVNSDVVIVTAGITKIPGKDDKEWNRKDLLVPCGNVMKEVGKAIKQYCPNAFVIVITNPLDVMVKVLQEASGVPTNMICGMAGVLDGGRFRRYIADFLGVAPRDVQALVIGAHGETMLPLHKHVTINGIHISEFIKKGKIKQKDIDDIVTKTKFTGNEIVQLLGQGSAYYAPGASAIAMAESFLKDEKRVMSCACYLKGEYGHSDTFCGVPCVIGAKGIERVIEMELYDDEKKALDENIKEVGKLMKEYRDADAKSK